MSKPVRPETVDAVLERWLGLAPDLVDEARRPAVVEPINVLIHEARMRTFRDDYPAHRRTARGAVRAGARRR